MKKIIIILMLLLLPYFVSAITVPRGDSIEIRHTSDWNINDVENYLVNQKPDPAEPGGYVELRFKIENIGADYAKDIVFELVPTYPFSLEYGTSAARKIGDMYMQQVGDEAYMLYYKVRVDKNAIDGNNPIRLRYSDDDGETWSQVEFDVRIQTSNPLLSINSVVSDPEEIPPGARATLTVNLENKANSILRFLRVNLGVVTKTVTSTTVTTAELPFTPIGSTNEKMVESLGPHESINLTFDLVADASASSKVYKLPITIDYTDSLGTNFSKSYYTSVVIGDQPDITATIDKSEIISPKESGTITIKFTNKGSSDLKFLYAELLQSDKYDIISQPEVYIGNIDSDDYETADFKIYAKTRDKNIQIPLRLEYRDANYKVFKKDIILNLRLYSSSEAKKYGLVKSSSPVFGLIFILIILFGVWYYFKRKKNIDLAKVLINKVKNLRKK